MNKDILGNKTYGDFDVTVYQTQNKTIVYEMKGFMLPSYVSEFFNDLFDYAKKYKPVAMVADASEMKVLNKEVQRAIQRDFWPVVGKLGVIYNPIITPKSTLSSGSVDRLIDSTQTITIDQGIILEIGTFNALENALEWISNETKSDIASS